MATQIQFELSLDDYLAAQRLHSTRNLWPRIMNFLLYFLYPVLGILFLFFGVGVFLERNSHHPVTMIVCGVLLVCSPIYMRMRLRSCYKRTRSDSGESTLNFGEERVEIKGRYTNSELDWRAVKSFREDAKVFMLYLAPGRFIVIPKRACTEAQISDLRAIFLQKVPPVIQ